jgi:hypothetical protein
MSETLSYINTWARLSQSDLTRKNAIDLEVEIYATKLANENSPWAPMHEIKGETSENGAYR